MLKVRQDTAVFSRRQWYVEGYTGPSCWFSTKEDAEAAAAVASQYAVSQTDQLAERVVDFMNNVDLDAEGES